MATNQVPLYLDPGVGVRRYTGTDTIYHNLTDSSGNVLDLQKNAASVLTIANEGMLKVATVTSPVATVPSLDIQGRPDVAAINSNQLLRLYDADVGESVFAVTKFETDQGTGAWAANIVLRNPDTPQALDEALRITHDLRENSPTYPAAKLLTIGYTSATGVYQEQSKFDQSGSFYIRNDIKWLASGGFIGSSDYAATTTPSRIYAVTSVNAAGTSLLENEVRLGQDPLVDGDRQVTAVLTGTDAYIRWDNSVGYWTMFDGSTEYPIGTSTITDWDSLYAADKTLTLDSATPLTWTQTDVLGYGFILNKTVSTAANAIMKIESTNTSAFPVGTALLEVHRSAFNNPGIALSLKGHLDFAVLNPATAAKITSANALEISTSGSSDRIAIKTTGNDSDITIETASTITSSDIFITSRGQLYMKNIDTTADVTVDSASKLSLLATEGVDITGSGGTWALGTALSSLSHTGNGNNGFRMTFSGAANLVYNHGQSNHILVPNSHFLLGTQSASKDMYVESARDTHFNSTRDIKFDARATTAPIAFNTAVDKDLTTTKQSIVGAINEIDATVGAGTLDAAYNNDAGSAAIAVDAGSVTWNLSGAYVTQFTKALSASPGGAAYSVKNAISSSANLVSGDKLVAYYGRGVGNGALDHAASEVVAFQAIGDAVTGGTSYGFHADANCDYGVYSLSPGYVADAPAASPAGALTVFQSSFTSPKLDNGDTVALFQANVVGDTLDDAGATYAAFLAEGTDVGNAARYGIVIDSKWDLGLLSFAKVSIGDTLATAEDGLVVNSTSGLLTAGKFITGIRSAVTGNGADDIQSAIYGFYAEGTATGSAQKYGFYADSVWTYGLYTTVKNYAETTGPSASTFALTAPFNAKVTSPNMGATAVGMGMNSEVVTHTSDAANSSISAFSANMDIATSGPGRSNRTAYRVGGNFGYFDSTNNEPSYAIYSNGGQAYFSQTQTNGFGGSKIFKQVRAYVDSTGTGLDAFDTVVMYSAEIAPDADDATNASYYGLYAFGSAVGDADKIGVYADVNWNYGVKSLSPIWSEYAATNAITITPLTGGAFIATAKSPAAGFTVAGVAVGVAIELVDHVSDHNGAIYYGTYVSTEDNDTSVVKYGHWAHDSLDYAFYANDCHIESDTDYVAANMYSTSKGAINVVTSNSSALSDTTRYGVKVDHSGHAGDSGGVNIHNFHSSGDAVGGAFKTGYYAGAGGSQGLIYGFYSQNVARGLYCVNGTASVTTQSSTYAPTASENALFYSNLSSSTFSSGTWYNNAARYTYHASDVGGTWYGYFAETSGTLVAGVQTIGFQVQSNVDVGIRSYSAQNRFQRPDDSSTTTQPLVLIQQSDNDSVGGTAPALLVQNVYTGTTGQAIEIDHGYNGSAQQDTRRAIVFSSAQSNKRQVPCGHFQPNTTNTSTQYWMFQNTSTTYRWYCFGTLGRSISIPLMAPHNSVIKSVDVYCYNQLTATSGAKIILYGKDINNGTANSTYGTTTTTTTAGAHTITISGLSVAVNNHNYEYWIKHQSASTSSSSQSYLYTAHVTYEITDFAAACGF